MAYLHGVYTNENATPIIAPVQVDSAVQVAVGVAPVNNTEIDPLEPQIAYTHDEAVKKMGMAKDIMAYTLCQVTKASFEIYNIAPVVYINVLDPGNHKKDIPAQILQLIGNTGVIEHDGVIFSTLVVKSSDGSKNYELGTDYILEVGSSGYPIVEITKESAIEEGAALQVSYSKLDPSAVTKDDILKGINKIRDVYPKFNIVPGQLIAPGWSHIPEVYNALTAQTERLNGIFSSFVLADVDTEEVNSYDEVNKWKNQNGFTDKNSEVLFPMLKIGDDKYYFSAIKAALIALTDYENEGVPYVSPSNKDLKISGTILKDGTEVMLDLEQANLLNGQGISTAINMNGWKAWGNNTACYPANTDVKDRWVPVRRMFIWWSNTFILTYWQKVDDPTNLRLVESVIDSENIRANGFISGQQIADAKIVLHPSLTETDLLNGHLLTLQKLTPFPPMEALINTMEYDVSALLKTVTGGATS